jgi:carboxymethylenebutenolidase
MCFDHDARPPALPRGLAIAAGGAAAESLELTSADGTRFSAALAESPGAREPAVVILPDVRGLYRFYVELAERFAEAGHHAIAIDYFGRTAGTGERENDWDFMPHVDQTQATQIQEDVAAAIAACRERTGAERFVTVGFCFGGSQSFLAATNPDLPLAGVVGFYGGLTRDRAGSPRVLDRVEAIDRPVLGLFGGADQGIPEGEVRAFEQALGDRGQITVYPGAPHSFFDRSQAEHAEASEDAWRRTLAFLGEI